MKRIVITAIFPLLAIACATGIGKKMPRSTIDKIQAEKGKLTYDEVRHKIGAPPQTQMHKEL